MKTFSTETPIVRSRDTARVEVPRMWFRVSSSSPAEESDMIIGEVRIFAGAIPPGWLPLGSGPVSRTTYASLFAYLGTTYGAGDGLTTFGIPPAERMPIPAGAQAGFTTRVAGDIGGAETVTLLGSESGSQAGIAVTINDPGHSHGAGSLGSTGHTHPLGASASVTITDPGHFHLPISANFVINNPGALYESTIGDSGADAIQTDNAFTGISAAIGGATDSTSIGLDSGNTGSGATGISAQASDATAAQAHENMPPFCAYNFAIYAGV